MESYYADRAKQEDRYRDLCAYQAAGADCEKANDRHHLDPGIAQTAIREKGPKITPNISQPKKLRPLLKAMIAVNTATPIQIKSI
jgi:hypothetical protein